MSGGIFNTRGISVDQEAYFCVGEVGNGCAQKFRWRQGANPALLVGKPVCGVEKAVRIINCGSDAYTDRKNPHPSQKT
jgi:hypothetical protein